MELKRIKEIRRKYIELLSEDKEYENTLKNLVNKDIKDPIFDPTKLESEDIPNYNEEQKNLSEIALDLKGINSGILEIKNKIKDLINTVDSAEANALESIKKEEQRIMDINMICGIKSEYNMCIPIYANDFEGKVQSEVLNSSSFGAKPTNLEEVEYSIVDIAGNGYEGNEYIYNNYGEEEKEIEDRSNRDFILDKNDTTCYEYSRLNTDKKEEAIDGLINYDNKEARCTITCAVKKPVCKTTLFSEDEHVVVEKVEVSNDGIGFTNIFENPLKMNEMAQSYKDISYAYGSRTICFPYSTFVRITMSSDVIRNDIVIVKDKNGVPIKTTNTRHKKVQINNISFFRSEYSKIEIKTRNILESGSVDKIGIFANEYVPDHFTANNYIKYSLIINGTEFEIIPINSDRNGTKIIKYAEKESISVKDWYTTTINETIKTAQLKITISDFKKKETPYVSNIKICLGKDTGSIYV